MLTGADGRPGRVLLLGGTSEIGLAILAALNLSASTEVLLAGRDQDALTEIQTSLPYVTRTLSFDALDFPSHEAFADQVFADGPVDLVISAAGVLIPQPQLDRDPLQAAQLIGTNLTGHVTTLLACAARMRPQGEGTIVVLSSIAAVRPRRANLVYGASKAGLDAFARGLADSLHSSGVRILLIRPGFVTGRMTTGLPPAPLATTPAEVGRAVAAALGRSGRGGRGGRSGRDDRIIWVPRSLALLAIALRLTPRALWRRVRR